MRFLICTVTPFISENGDTAFRNNLQIDLTRGLRFEKWAQVFAVWMPDTIRGEAAEQCRLMLDTAHNKAVDNRLIRLYMTKAI